MELRDLKAFVTLGEVMHFGQAAARQHVTQSALSKQIRRLEAALGGELFERNAGSTRFTALGRALYGEACTLVAQSEQLARSARDVLAGNGGTLRIGFGVATKPPPSPAFGPAAPGSPSSSTISPPITSCWRWPRGGWISASAACPPPRAGIVCLWCAPISSPCCLPLIRG